jgi:F-type H+-transporting ATPase subunit b
VPSLIAAASPSPSPTTAKTNNFLIPNGTFIVELIIFLVILAVIGKYVVPFVNMKLAERQEAIRLEFKELEDARAKLEATEAEYRDLVAGARADAAQQREEARQQGAQILADMRATAQAESERIIKAAEQQIAAERSRTVEALRAEVGTLAVDLASRVIGESLTDDARQRRVVERFLVEVESRAGETAAGEQVRG